MMENILTCRLRIIFHRETVLQITHKMMIDDPDWKYKLREWDNIACTFKI